MTPLNPRMMLELSGTPEELWVPKLYSGLGPEYGSDGPQLWTEEEVSAFERLSVRDRRRAVRGHIETMPTPSPEVPRVRRKYTRRDARLRKRRHIPGLRYVRRHSIDPFVDARLNDGARITLSYLIARCGKDRRWSALTCWVAEARAVGVRTIQNHYKALEAAGYIVASNPDSKTQKRTIYICAPAEAPRYRKKDESTQTSTHDSGAKNNSLTQPMKGESQKDKGDALSGTGSVASARSPNPGAELPRPAPPLDQALVADEKAPETLRKDEETSRPGSAGQEASGGPEAEPSAFDAAMAAILRRVEAFSPERRATGAAYLSRGPGVPGVHDRGELGAEAGRLGRSPGRATG